MLLDNCYSIQYYIVMEIETDRIILRAPNKADHPLFIGLCMDPKVTEHFEYIKRDSAQLYFEPYVLKGDFE